MKVVLIQLFRGGNLFDRYIYEFLVLRGIGPECFLHKPVTCYFIHDHTIKWYIPVILPKYQGKYQVFTIGARLLYLPVKLKRVYNGGPIVIGVSVTPFLRSEFFYFRAFFSSSFLDFCYIALQHSYPSTNNCIVVVHKIIII